MCQRLTDKYLESLLLLLGHQLRYVSFLFARDWSILAVSIISSLSLALDFTASSSKETARAMCTELLDSASFFILSVASWSRVSATVLFSCSDALSFSFLLSGSSIYFFLSWTSCKLRLLYSSKSGFSFSESYSFHPYFVDTETVRNVQDSAPIL